MYERLFADTPRGLIGIYKITNTCTSKVYIGQSIDIRRRWTSHINILNNTNTNEVEKKSALHQSMLKYGVENFTFEIVELCSEKELNEREQYWIREYNSYLKGYNETIGGDAFRFYPEYVDEVIDLLMNSNKTYEEISELTGTSIQSVSNINRGVSFKNEKLNYPLRSWTHAVIQYDTDGNELNRFSSIKDAAESTGVTNTNIRSVCTNYEKGQKLAGGFQWRYIEDEGKDLNRRSLNKKRVGKFTKQGEKIAEYDSAAEASRNEGVLRDHISRVCRGERKTLYGFVWKYID